MGSKDNQHTQLQKPKSKRARRILEKREPKLVEDAKKALLLYAGKTSQVVKDVLADIQKLKPLGDSVKYTGKNPDARPFEIGGEVALEHFAKRTECSLFALGSHTKKRPHNLILGRFFNNALHDVVEFGVDKYFSIQHFAGAAKLVRVGGKPCFVFLGDGFDSVPELKTAKSLLLDFFRGQQVDNINLAGLDHVIFVTPQSPKLLLLRQYSIVFKKSGTRIPRVELAEMGPSLNLSIRRTREAPTELANESMKQPKVAKRKEKNVGYDNLDGRVGKIYIPKQNLSSIALNKMKGLKRERQSGGGGATKKPKVST
jgi:ribosome production factor 2